jgi:hypothetical protein
MERSIFSETSANQPTLTGCQHQRTEGVLSSNSHKSLKIQQHIRRNYCNLKTELEKTPEKLYTQTMYQAATIFRLYM